MDPNFHVTSATFNHKFKNFSKINKLTQSPACWIQNLPWKIFIGPMVRDKKKYLSVFVSCAAAITTNPWSCRANVRSYKLDGSTPKVIKSTQYLVFDSAASTSWGHDTFILWDSVLKASNGYISNDTITIEVIIDALEPVGLKLTSNFYTDERANTAMKLCEQTISNFQSKIQQLTEQNEDLRKSSKTSTDQIKSLEEILNISKQKCAELEEKFNKEQNKNTNLQKTIESTSKQLQQRINENADLTKSLKEKDELITTLSKNVKRLESLETEQMKCKGDREELESKLTSLSNDCRNSKAGASQIVSENKDELSENLIALQNENAQLKENSINMRKQLSDADEKLMQMKILENEIEVLKREKLEIAKNIDLISKELQESESIIDIVKNETQEHEKKQHKNSEFLSQIWSLKSQLNETLVKLKILQDVNKGFDNTKTEYEELLSHYNELKKEKATILSKMDSLNGQLSKANDDIVILKKEIENSEKEIRKIETELNETKNSNMKLQENNKNITLKLQEVNAKIKSFEDNNSEDLTNLVNEKNILTNKTNDLLSQVKILSSELEEIKKKKLDVEINQLKSEKEKLKTQLESANKNLEDTKTQLSKTQKEIKSFIETEKSASLLQSKLDNYKNKLKIIEEKKLDEVISKLKADKMRLESLVDSLRKQPAVSEITNCYPKDSLQKIVDKTKTHDEEKRQIEEPDFGIDLVKDVKDKSEATQEEKTDINNESNLQVIRNIQENEIEKQLLEADSALKMERKLHNEKVNNLLNQMKEEKEKNYSTLRSQEKLEAEIYELKEGTEVLQTLKNDFFKQLKTCRNICFDFCNIIVCILKDLKDNDKLSCSVDAFIISFLSDLKNSEFWMSVANQGSLNQIKRTDITLNGIEAKVEQLRNIFKENTMLIRKNYALEQNENSNLRAANKELLVLFENEANVSKQYKKMLIIANSRLRDFRRQLSEFENKFFDERTRRLEYEETCRQSTLLLEDTESLMDDLKQKIMKHAIKLSSIVEEEDSNNSIAITADGSTKTISASDSKNSSLSNATQHIDDNKTENIEKPLSVLESSVQNSVQHIEEQLVKSSTTISGLSNVNSEREMNVSNNEELSPAMKTDFNISH